ncbi:MAG: DUF2975 domain-containing protein [Colwellia sp.]|nr:DUF2975 domain-containing protein [Colwellia sp.]
MSKISKASKYICALLIAMATFQLTTHLLLLFFGEQTAIGLNKLTINFSFFSSYIAHQTSHNWLNISQALEAENFNSLAILGSMELLPYLLIYFFLFKLFKFYQQGQIFTVANIACFKNIGKTLLAWIGFSIFYPVLVTLFIRLSGLSDSLAIYISFGSREFFYLVSGLIIYVMAWIMTMAIELKQEQEFVI